MTARATPSQILICVIPRACRCRKVLPSISSAKSARMWLDAWIDKSKTKVGYEIPLNRHFYRYEPPRPVDVIETDIKTLEQEIMGLLSDLTGSNGVTL